MPQNKYHIGILLALGIGLLMDSCVVPFEPEIHEPQSLMVISGHITNIPGPHYVSISKSSPYDQYARLPVGECVVIVEDNEGNKEFYTETRSGVYEAILDAPFLNIGKAYSVQVITPSNAEYRSDFDTLLNCPTIGSIYYEINDPKNAGALSNSPGIQFYTDLNGSIDEAHAFKWVLYETWEYQTPHVAELTYLDGRLEAFDGNEIRTCYMTEQIPSFYTASTVSLAENRITRFPLAFVSGDSPRLLNKYSLLIRQQSLSDQAYAYWNAVKTYSNQSFSLYETQPTVPEGNIYNVNDWEEEVLGVFYASHIQEERVFVTENFPFPVYPIYCEPSGRIESMEGFRDKKLYYLVPDNPNSRLEPPFLEFTPSCIDCRLHGGVLERPEFW